MKFDHSGNQIWLYNKGKYFAKGATKKDKRPMFKLKILRTKIEGTENYTYYG